MHLLTVSLDCGLVDDLSFRLLAAESEALVERVLENGQTRHFGRAFQTGLHGLVDIFLHASEVALDLVRSFRDICRERVSPQNRRMTPFILSKYPRSQLFLLIRFVLLLFSLFCAFLG